jgi:hypothetical protein
VIVRFGHVASGIVNVNHSAVCAAEVLGVPNSVIDFQVSQPAEWQRGGNEINVAMIFARSDLVNVRCRRAHCELRG